MIESQPPPTKEDTPAELTTVNTRQWTYREIASIKRVSIQTVQKWVSKGMIPSPVYSGATARFTPEQVQTILLGTQPAGTFEVAHSPRRENGRKGGMNSPRPNEKRANYKSANKRKVGAKKPAKKVAAKKPAKKRRAG